LTTSGFPSSGVYDEDDDEAREGSEDEDAVAGWPTADMAARITEEADWGRLPPSPSPSPSPSPPPPPDDPPDDAAAPPPPPPPPPEDEEREEDRSAARWAPATAAAADLTWKPCALFRYIGRGWTLLHRVRYNL